MLMERSPSARNGEPGQDRKVAAVSRPPRVKGDACPELAIVDKPEGAARQRVHGLHANAPFGNERGVLLFAGPRAFGTQGLGACDHAGVQMRRIRRRGIARTDHPAPTVAVAAIGWMKGQR